MCRKPYVAATPPRRYVLMVVGRHVIRKTEEERKKKEEEGRVYWLQARTTLSRKWNYSLIESQIMSIRWRLIDEFRF